MTDLTACRQLGSGMLVKVALDRQRDIEDGVDVERGQEIIAAVRQVVAEREMKEATA
jgi:hypothetical protein